MTAVTDDEGDVPAFWRVDSSPFSAGGPRPQPCRIVLRQIDDNDFELVETLVLDPPTAMRDRPEGPLVIEPGWLTSDLASIPGILGWFARRHGRHTPASLVHDFLITGKDETPPAGLPTDWVLPPRSADLLFRETLLASGVPPVRAYLMWAAVTARTRWRTGVLPRLALLAWALAATIGTVALVVGLVWGPVLVAGVALVAPIPASALWGGEFRAGLVAGYAVWWALVGAAPAWIAYKLYQGVEGLVWLVRWRRRVRAGVPPEQRPPAPVPYDER